MDDKLEIDQRMLQRFIPCQTLPTTHLNHLIKGAKLQKIERS